MRAPPRRRVPRGLGAADDRRLRGRRRETQSGDAREARRDAREVAETRRRARRLRRRREGRRVRGFFAQSMGAGRARARSARRRAARAGAAAAHARARSSSRCRRRGRFFFGRRRRRRRRRRTRRPRNGRRDPKKKKHLTIDELCRSSARFRRVDARRAGGYLRASLASRRRAEPRVVRGFAFGVERELRDEERCAEEFSTSRDCPRCVLRASRDAGRPGGRRGREDARRRRRRRRRRVREETGREKQTPGSTERALY